MPQAFYYRRLNRHTRIRGLYKAIAFTTLMLPTPVFALSVESAVEGCRMRVGRPIVMRCMQGGGGNLEACRARATPSVQSCVKSALAAANGRANVALAVPTASVPKVAAGTSLPVGFVAPPRTIADITAILDSEKPDPAKIDKLKADADAVPPANASRAALAQFYVERCNARAQLSRIDDAIADANKGIEVGRGSAEPRLMARLVQTAASLYGAQGDPKKALELYQRLLRDTAGTPGAKGFVHTANRSIADLLIKMGDIAQAEGYMRRSIPAIEEARTSGHPMMRASYAKFGQNWESEIDLGKGYVFEARGLLKEAEASYQSAEARKLAGMASMLKSDNGPTESAYRQSIDFITLGIARVKARQNRLAEAEVDARRALLARLKDRGKYDSATPRFVVGLASILVDQGRHAEAEKLVREALDIAKTIGLRDDAPATVQILSQLGSVLNLQRKGQEAVRVFAQIDRAIADWEPKRKQVFELNNSRIMSLYISGQIDAGIAASEQMVKAQAARVGEDHPDTASARGMLAVGFMRAKRDADAIREFKAAIPILVTSTRENAGEDDSTLTATRNLRLQGVVENYLKLLSQQSTSISDVGVETFALADAIRGSSVQQALSASSARSAVKDPALAELVRKEQDLSKQIQAQLGSLTNALSLSSAERDEKTVSSLNASIAAMRTERSRARDDIGRRFPTYADLVSPKAPTVADIRQTLEPDEAMLSFYFGQDSSFVWAVPKNGPVAFAAIGARAADVQGKITKLREALEPQAAMISDIPAFDVALGHELYSLLLKPVEAGWKPAKKLIVVTNGALGLLPLSLLPTAPAEIKTNEDVLFASYRDVPWLARTHAVTMVPSAAALRTLRQLPAGKSDRGELIAFGDPYFNTEQQIEAEQIEAKVRVADAADSSQMRGIPLKRRNSPKLDGVDSAELGLLPRLPDTADELRSIALALQADPSKVLNLGKNATEKAVKTTNLSGFKIIAFATHGLVPGELNGLTQPALALSSPTVTGETGDGLLTMEEILGLKLDADWVILSACNTGSGAGAGAEAASGLGRAFFYAGTRALLVTNWSVHSQSARELMTDLFKRQADDSKLARSESQRQAMMALADGAGYLNAEGKTEFAYAHPLFWAPYSIIGDGGAR